MSHAESQSAILRGNRAQTDDFIRRVNVAIGYDKLSLEDRLRGAVREALAEVTPAWILAMQTIPVWRKLENSNSMFLTARDLLYHQVIRAGCSPDRAYEEAARRLLNGNAW